MIKKERRDLGNYQYKKNYKKPFKKKEEEKKFDVERWLKQHSNIEYPKRGKKNSLGDKKNKRRK